MMVSTHLSSGNETSLEPAHGPKVYIVFLGVELALR